MEASALDLGKRMREVMMAIDRHETVTLTHRGKCRRPLGHGFRLFRFGSGTACDGPVFMRRAILRRARVPSHIRFSIPARVGRIIFGDRTGGTEAVFSCSGGSVYEGKAANPGTFSAPWPR